MFHWNCISPNMFRCLCLKKTLKLYLSTSAHHLRSVPNSFQSQKCLSKIGILSSFSDHTSSLCIDGAASGGKYLQIRNIQTSRPYFEVQIVQTPPFAESITEGDVRWEKEVGDEVKVDEVIGEIETDKTALPIISPCAGVLEELIVADGDTVHKGDDLAKINTTGVEVASPSGISEVPPLEESLSKPQAGGMIGTQEQVAPEKLISRTAASPPSTPPSPSQTPLQSSEDKLQVSEMKIVKEAPARVMGSRVETKVKMNKMRLRIAERLKDAQNTNAMLTTFNEIDMSNAMDMRKKYKDLFMKKHGLKLSFMSAFVKGSAVALEQMPTVNAVIDDEYVVYRDFVDISVAVATPKGLLVPVLRNVHDMNFADVENGMAALAEKARKGTIAIEDMDGGTFTISNGGVFGSLMGTPIINPPQSAILGMHGIFDRPVAINGKVEIRPMMYVALTYDHRLIDGREAVTFLRKIKQNVEDPVTMLLDI